MDGLPLIARATHHAAARLPERHGMEMTTTLLVDVMSAIIAGRTRRIANAAQLRQAYDDGAIFTHVFPDGLERWRVRVGGEWIDFVVKDCAIITVLPRHDTSKKTQRAPRNRRNTDDRSQIDDAF